MLLMIGLVDNEWTVQQVEGDRFKGVLLSSFKHLAPVWQPEGVDGVKELEMDVHTGGDFVAKLDVAA